MAIYGRSRRPGHPFPACDICLRMTARGRHAEAGEIRRIAEMHRER